MHYYYMTINHYIVTHNLLNRAGFRLGAIVGAGYFFNMLNMFNTERGSMKHGNDASIGSDNNTTVARCATISGRIARG